MPKQASRTFFTRHKKHPVLWTASTSVFNGNPVGTPVTIHVFARYPFIKRALPFINIRHPFRRPFPPPPIVKRFSRARCFFAVTESVKDCPGETSFKDDFGTGGKTASIPRFSSQSRLQRFFASCQDIDRKSKKPNSTAVQ